jgi:antitoxin component YwqK of YwqJK toxin-antitoxin module
MKTSILFVLLTIVFTTGPGSKRVSWDEHNLKGKVKSYTQKTYSASEKFGVWEAGELKDMHYMYKFNPEGMCTEFCMYQRDDLKLKTIYEYRKGRPYERRTYDQNDRLVGRVVPTYRNGKIVEDTHYDDDGTFLYKRVFNHLSDNEIEYIAIGEKGGNSVSKASYLYDGRKLLKSSLRYSDGDLNWGYTTLYEYDSNGNLSKQTLRDGSDTTFVTTLCLTADTIGNCLKTLVLSSERSDNELGSTSNTIIISEYEYYK